MFRYTNPDKIIAAIKTGRAGSGFQKVSADKPFVSRERFRQAEENDDPVLSNQEMIKEYLEMVGLDPAPPQEAEEVVRPRKRVEGSMSIGEASDSLSPGYPEDLTQKEIELIIEREAVARDMDPSVAIAIFRSEGAGNYQSQIQREGKGSAGGKEASYGPYQLYIGGGLGNEYEESTGRSLVEDNTREGIVKQIQFSLDKAAEGGWSPWYGRKTAGVGVNQGLENAKPIYNWKDEEYASND